jgi:hypothetical protein
MKVYFTSAINKKAGENQRFIISWRMEIVSGDLLKGEAQMNTAVPQNFGKASFLAFPRSFPSLCS